MIIHLTDRLYYIWHIIIVLHIHQFPRGSNSLINLQIHDVLTSSAPISNSLQRRQCCGRVSDPKEDDDKGAFMRGTERD